jgi:hypothetical protein
MPSIVFIVPYRDREHEKVKYLESMESLGYEIYFAHQCDNRPFNRGAMRNIGFLAVKAKYPDTYKDITLVFNDVDTFPAPDNLPNYETIQGVVKHFYGFTYTLGGIFSILASDFERINGYPNFWAWGYEDNALNARCVQNNIAIDRSDFVDVRNPRPDWDKKIVNLKDAPFRDLNYGEFKRYLNQTAEGISDVRNLAYSIVAEKNVFMVNIAEFAVATNHPQKNIRVDMRRGGNPFKQKRMQMRFT